MNFRYYPVDTAEPPLLTAGAAKSADDFHLLRAPPPTSRSRVSKARKKNTIFGGERSMALRPSTNKLKSLVQPTLILQFTA